VKFALAVQGVLMPENGREQLLNLGAIYFGAVGAPAADGFKFLVVHDFGNGATAAHRRHHAVLPARNAFAKGEHLFAGDDQDPIVGGNGIDDRRDQ
jgi:hypothetical protein